MLQQMGFTSIRDRDVHGIISLVVTQKQSFSKADHKVTPRFLRTKVGWAITIRNYIFNLVLIVVENIFKVLPEHVAKAFDRWTAARTHYIEAFLVYSTSTRNKELLLDLALLSEEDDLGAKKYVSPFEKEPLIDRKRFVQRCGFCL